MTCKAVAVKLSNRSAIRRVIRWGGTEGGLNVAGGLKRIFTLES